MPFESRFLIILLPPFFLGVSMAYRPIAKLSGDRRIVYGVIILLIALSIPSLTGFYSGFTKEDWRGMAGIMRTEAKQGDIIVLVPSYMYLPFDYYYNNATAGTIEVGASSVGELERIRESKGNRQMYMIVTADLLAVDPSRETVSWLDNNAQYLGDYTNIYLFLA
jgi:mannosyltransferase